MRYDDILTDEQLHRYTQQFNLRARKYNQPALPLALIRDRILESAGQCEWCGDNLVGKDFELDHVVSLRQGGQHQANNLVVACPDCNRRKAEKAPLQFALEIVARKGKTTPWVQKLLEQHEVQAYTQRSLFDDDPKPNDKAESSEEDTDFGDVRPYRW
jgi:5-methylcytosine-specific restriction endonuclease McrA